MGKPSHNQLTKGIWTLVCLLAAISLTTSLRVTPSPNFDTCTRMQYWACSFQNFSVVTLKPLCDLIAKNENYLNVTNNGFPPIIFHYNPCEGNLPRKCPKFTASGQVAVCQQSGTTYKNIGIVSGAPTSSSTSPKFTFMTSLNRLLIRYSDTEPFSETTTTVECLCNWDKIYDPVLTYKGPEIGQELQLEHVCCCPGSVYNFRNGEHGKYILPNILLWEQCAKDVKLGAKICVGSAKPGVESYTSIDGNNPKPGEIRSFDDDIAVNYHNPEPSTLQPRATNQASASAVNTKEDNVVDPWENNTAASPMATNSISVTSYGATE